jgi:hypothetical protein
MEYKCAQLSSPKIKAFLSIYSHLKTKYRDSAFGVEEAIRWINAQPELRIWCYRDRTCDKLAKTRAEKEGFISLDLQNACHCFAGNTKCSVIDVRSNQIYQLLDHVGKLTYRIRKE